MKKGKLFMNNVLDIQTKNQSSPETTKQCPHCKENIPIAASKCSHCGSDLRAWFNRHPFLTTILAIIVFAFVIGIIGNTTNQSNNSSSSNQINNTSETNLNPTPATSTAPNSSTAKSRPPESKAIGLTPEQQAAFVDAANHMNQIQADAKAAENNTQTIDSVYQAHVTNSAPTPTWHTVQTFTGSGGTNTASFTIQGSQWQVKWTATGDNSNSYCQQNGCYFIVIPFYVNGDSADGYIDSEVYTTTSDVSYFYKPGQYYLNIPAGNITNWTITVLDYY